jgi:hypothetical protein
MASKITKNKRDQWNDILKQLREFFFTEADQIAQVAYKKGASYRDLAEATGSTRTNITKKYPKKGGSK